MDAKQLSLVIICLALSCAGLHLLAGSRPETQLKTVFEFDTRNGKAPGSALVAGADGKFYGTTRSGGTYGQGTVYEVSRSASGITEKVLYSFTGGADGGAPEGLVSDSVGNLYGVTSQGGKKGSACGTLGCGVAFEITGIGIAAQEAVLHTFAGNDGNYPSGSLIFDASGNLYGETVGGGAQQRGTVFELVESEGLWNHTILYSFTGNNGDASHPSGGLIFDSFGNLYGASYSGGGHTSVDCDPAGCGTIFKLSPSNGSWAETTLHAFTQQNGDGSNPMASLISDGAGNFYGTAMKGGITGGSCPVYGCGVVFEVSLANGEWTYTNLYTFRGGASDAATSESSLIFDTAGDILGTSYAGGPGNCDEGECGTLFELTPQSGAWSESIVHFFTGANGDGASPLAALVPAGDGIYISSAVIGGKNNTGVIFAARP